MTSAELCRKNGWTPGTVLVVALELYHIATVVTAVGVDTVLTLNIAGKDRRRHWRKSESCHQKETDSRYLTGEQFAEYRPASPSELASMGPEVAAEIERIRKVLGVESGT